VSSTGLEGAYRVGPDADPDRYVLGAAVASGAEGILYRGWITTATGVILDVAIKMLQPRFLSRVQEWHARWAEQVELLRSLQVPGVVPVRDGFLGPLPHAPGQAGEGQTLYLVMNWVDGESLDEWIRHRPDRDPIDDLRMLLPVAAALDLMHSGRATGGIAIVHRDVKPSNILVTDQASVLVDFGLTRGLPDGPRPTAVVGTPGYLAPETNQTGSYSPATDRYALGAVAYFVVTGFEPPTSHQPEILRTLLAAVPALAERPEILDQITAMLATDPDSRPEGLANWIGQLRRSSLAAGPDLLNPPAPRRHPSRPPPPTPTTPIHRITRRWVTLAAAGTLTAAIAVGAVFYPGTQSPTRQHSTSPTRNIPPTTPPAPLPGGIANLANLGISIVDVRATLADGLSSGTGFIISDNGVIITDNNTIAGATKITVFINGTSYPATAIGEDPTADEAVLKVQGLTNLPSVNLDDSSTVTVAQPVAVISDPFGAGRLSVKTGSILAVDQSITTFSSHSTLHLAGLIETNAPITPGANGGPLIDASGAVIGLDAASSTGSTYFALPINSVRNIADAIESGRGGNGIFTGPTALLGINVNSSAVPGGGGVTVSQVAPGSPANNAGIVPGDAILDFGGVATTTAAALSNLIAEHHQGDHVNITFRESAGRVTKQVVLGTGPVP